MENSGGEGGLAILEFGGQGGDKHFGISEGKGGGKILMPPVVGYGYFQESPIFLPEDIHSNHILFVSF